MNTSKKNVPIKKVLPSVIGEEKSDQYLKGLNFAYIDSKDIYEKSLAALMSGDTETCLKLMIFGLDIDRSYTPLLNLCRTMLFGLSDILKDGDFETYKHKYKDFSAAKISLTKKIDDLIIKIDNLKIKIDEIEEKVEGIKPKFFSFQKLYVIYKLKMRKIEPYRNQYASEKDNYELLVKKVEKEMAPIDRLVSIEESMQVLNLIVEVCTVPVRFEWAIV